MKFRAENQEFVSPTSCDNTIVGIDEVGTGCLAGPVVAAAVILNSKNPIGGIKDSKKISAKKRKVMADQIMVNALDWAIGQASVYEIDHYNILRASHLAMQRAFNALSHKATIVLVDGNRLPDFPIDSRAIVNGDQTIPSIGAASIIAKVFRDDLMEALGSKHPSYDFEKNKGYPTAAHMQRLRDVGPCPHHRKSFAPVKNWNITN